MIFIFCSFPMKSMKFFSIHHVRKLSFMAGTSVYVLDSLAYMRVWRLCCASWNRLVITYRKLEPRQAFSDVNRWLDFQLPLLLKVRMQVYKCFQFIMRHSANGHYFMSAILHKSNPIILGYIQACRPWGCHHVNPRFWQIS